MKTSYQCIECFLRQIDKASSVAKLGPKDKERLLGRLTKKLLAFNFSQPPVVFGRTIYKTVASASGQKDIFQKEKIKTEQYLLKFSSSIEKLFTTAADPLHTAVRFSCAANAIDFGVGQTPNVKKLLSKIKNSRLNVDHSGSLRRKLKKSKNVLLIGDNCGEAIFDKFFVVQIKKYNPQAEVIYVTRSAPIINDVTIADAKRMGMDEVAKIISSGCDYPGLILSKTCAGFRKIYSKADIIISKGQGNFESFEGKKDIFYLFKVKCPAVTDYLLLPLGNLLCLHNKRITGKGVR